MEQLQRSGDVAHSGRELVQTTHRASVLTRLEAMRLELEYLLGLFPDDPAILRDLALVAEMEEKT